MRSLILTMGLAAAALAGCDSERSVRISSSGASGHAAAPVLKAVETLQCPQTQGVLTRTATGADGMSCTYSGPRGSEVTLRLMSLEETGADAALRELEAELRLLLPQAVGRLASAADAVSAAEAEAAAGATANETDGVEDVHVRLPGLTVRSEGDSTTIRLPGISIDSDGASSNVRVGGLRIDANERSGDVDIRSADDSVRVRASDDAAEIRTRAGGGGVRATYILVDEEPSQVGWRLVGYEARGPEGGPLVVAVVRSKDRREDEVFDAAKDLVALNAGG